MTTASRVTVREQEIFRAALDLVAERGYDRVTMDAVAAACRAGKATLYRRWTSKAALVVAALDDLDGRHDRPPADTGSVRGDLLSGMCSGMGFDDPWRVSVFTGLASALRADRELREAFIADFVDPRQRAMEQVFARAVERGEVAADLDVALVATVLPAVILFHADFAPGKRTDINFLTHVVDTVVLPMIGQSAQP